MRELGLNSEQELLQLVAEGCTVAYKQLFQEYWEQVYGAGLYLTKSPESAKDLAQEIFLKLWDNRSALPEIRNLSKYLFVITKNLFHDQLRKKIFQESNKEFLVDYFSLKENTPHEQLEKKEVGNALAEAISSLPPQLREVFVLKRLDGLSHQEISVKLNISPISTKTYLTRALILIRKHFDKPSRELFPNQH
ncbi:RNA polymerase RpoE-like sigma-24 subunit [Chitinophaga polysaccharea]|uniref:RNA polymerase RpoE-like sigma-24 subunit n=1 Tax=Chitinophaga polysaccharea TaxID=1293035 RepID=A0A561Q5S3_9BACT|nr:sigma-70 family RNA polymerase sigma factor [Chitinophaga polysaccharea]TWF45715.1 RNA polymerase RpoE-like sigma-24 subunit [Chitinophaga polysaccharea]